MNQKNALKFSIEYQAQLESWAIIDPDHANEKVLFDQAIVDATFVGAGGGYVEGFVDSIHGLDLEVAERLGNQMLSQLGVGAQFRTALHDQSRRCGRRVHLLPNGKIESAVCQ